MSLNPFAKPRCEKCNQATGKKGCEFKVRPTPDVANSYGHEAMLCGQCWLTTRPTTDKPGK